MSRAYDAAKAGLRNAGFLADYQALPDHLVEKAIRSLTKQVTAHQEWVADPFLKVARDIDPEQVKHLVEKKWPKEIRVFQEQMEILRDILKERKK